MLMAGFLCRCQGLIQEAVLLKPSVQVIQRLDDISDTVRTTF